MAFDAGHVAKPGAVDFAIRFANMRMNTEYTLADASCAIRRAKLVTFRMNVAWALRYFSGWSYPKIAALLDRDHATIMYLCRRFENKGKTPRAVEKRKKPNAPHTHNVRFSSEEIRSGL